MKFIYLMILLTLLEWGRVNGQPYYFSHYQVENGLSSNSVMCSMQDKKGFLWFGTRDGLNMFNGYQFKVFRNDPYVRQSLGGNFIHALHQDASGKIWVGTDRGLFQYHEDTESFTKLKDSPVEEIRDIQTDANHNLWFMSGYTLHRYNSKTGRIKDYPLEKYFEATSICVVGKEVWVGTSEGTVQHYDALTDSFTGYSVFNNATSTVSRVIQRMFDTGKGSLLVGTAKQGIKLFNTKTHSYQDLLMFNEDYTSIFARDIIHRTGDEYWIATESGVFIYYLNSGKWIQLKKQYNDPYSLSDNAIYTLCKDKEGGIWIGTYFGGICHYSTQTTVFEKYFPKVGENSLSGNAVREIHQDQNKNIWIGTEDGGLNKLSTDGKFVSFHPSAQKGTISNNNIHGLLVTGDTLWVGTFESGLDLFRISSGRVIRHYTSGDAPNVLKSNFIYAIYRTRAGQIWLATGRGLYNYNFKSGSLSRCTNFPDLFYTEVYEDSKGGIWAGTYSSGLYYLDPKTNRVGKLRYVARKESSLINDRINTIYEDWNHNVWFGTERGLYKFNPLKHVVKQYTSRDGFPSDAIFAILPDRFKRFWISTSKGLLCFDPQIGSLKVFTKASGLLSDQFNYRSAYQDEMGRMYFGSVKGMVRFSPFQISYAPAQPNYITGFQVDNRELQINQEGSPLSKSILLTDTVALKYNQSSFSIDFATLSYTAPEMTQYRYKMIGLDTRWTYLQTNRKAYFTGLAPGTYQFQFESASNNGVWSKPAKRLTVIISPPFWASRWAYVVYTLILTSAIYLILKIYHERLEAQNRRKIEKIQTEKDREIYESKISFFTNVAHEIRTPLTLITAPMERVMKAADEVPAIKNNLKIMEKNANRLLELTNQLLDFRKTEVNGYDLNFVRTNVNEFLQNTFQRFEDFSRQKAITYQLQLPEQHVIAYVDREALNKILSNLLDNAVKYANGKALVTLHPPTITNSNFTILVKNDGYLIPAEKREEIFDTFYRLKATEKLSGTGIGLPLARWLTELHKGTLVLLPTDGKMNIFQLVLPVHQQTEFNIAT